MYELKAERIRERYFEASGGFNDLSPDKAERKRRELVRGLGKLRQLSQHEPLRAEAIELFKDSIAVMKAIRDGEETPEQLKENARLFQRYIGKFENYYRKERE